MHLILRANRVGLGEFIYFSMVYAVYANVLWSPEQESQDSSANKGRKGLA